MSSQKQQEDFIKFVMISGLFIFPICLMIFIFTLFGRWMSGESLSENLMHPIFAFIMITMIVGFFADIYLCKRYYGWFEWLSFSKNNKK